jgi:hypothetical protein
VTGLQREADSLRAAVTQQDTLYILRRDTVDRVVVLTRAATDSVFVNTPVLTPGDTCFGIAAIRQWRDSLQAAIIAERAAADSALTLRDARIVQLIQTVQDYQRRLDAAIASSRPPHGWRTDAAIAGIALGAGLLLGGR